MPNTTRDSDQQRHNQIPPTEADDIISPEDVDIHGKLAHLNALDLSGLSLIKRYGIITLSHPAYSDELGRFMTTAGAYPHLPALSLKQTKAAIDALIKDGIIETWTHGGSTCWEIAGAYAYKPNLKWHMNERRKVNRRKREETEKRRQRKKDAEAGIPFAYEDDGKATAIDGVVIEKIRTKRGNLVSNHPEFFYNSVVPHRKKKHPYKMILMQPETTKGCIFRMLPSFDQSKGLSPLAAVIRFYLLMDSDDYGRVRADVNIIHGQLGSAITKRVSKNKIEQELKQMERSGHLILFKKKLDQFAYIRDAAQHMLEKKRYNRKIPKLYTDQEFTYDSDHYKAFFEAVKEHSAKRTKVKVAQYSEHGDVTVVKEYAKDAAERFAKNYEEIVSKEPYCTMTPEQVYEPSDINTPGSLSVDYLFYHGFKCELSADLMESLYLSDPDYFNGTSGDSTAHHILTHLIGMSPKEYVESLKGKTEGLSSSDAQEELPMGAPRNHTDSVPTVPVDDDPLPVVPGDDEIPPTVPL